MHKYFKDKIYLKEDGISINAAKLTEKYIKTYYNDLYLSVMKFDIISEKFTQKLWHYYNNIENRILCKYCETGLVKWINFNVGYSKFCCHRCSTLSEETKSNLKNTNLKKYGVECTFQSKEVKYKTKQTNLKKYGTEYATQSEEIKNKTKKTNLEKYGVDHSSKNKSVKEKTKKTNLEKYGVDNPFKSEEIKEKNKLIIFDKYGVDNVFKSKEIQEQIKKTNLEKYGFEYATQSKDIQNKVKNTNLEKYGVEYIMQNNELKERFKKSMLINHGVEYSMSSDEIYSKFKKTCLSKYGVEYPLQSKEISDKLKLTYLNKVKNRLINLNIKEDNIIDFNIKYASIFCEKCSNDYTTSIGFISQRVKKYNINPCINCNPIKDSSSASEKELASFIIENYNDIVLIKDRQILKPKELDIFIPNLNLAFEFNGIFWHSEKYADRNDHLFKTEKCLEQGIQLIHIFEDDWLYKKDIVKSYILKLLNKSNIIDSDKCIIKNINNIDSQQFLEQNYIDGLIISDINIGLYFNDTLVSIMSFDILDDNIYELTSYCDILNYNVIGSSDKLFKHFILNYSPKNIISIVDRNWNNGSIETNLGFELDQIIEPDYDYVINDKRTDKNDIFVGKMKNENFDFSEHEIMLSKKIYRIYNAGYLKFIYNL